jgi:hypothetical protein
MHIITYSGAIENGGIMISQLIISAGLGCDIVGAFLVANEVVRVFSGPTTIDTGDTGTINGGFIPAPNPDFKRHEKRKRLIMGWGLTLLVIGFLLQGLGSWWPVDT